jgi:hypothetical protein
MHRVYVQRAIVLLLTFGLSAAAVSGTLTVSKNGSLFIPAAGIASNGVPGATNLIGSKFMISALIRDTAQGGRASLVNTQVWVQLYGGGYNQANQVGVDGAGHVLVTGASSIQSGYGFATVSYDGDGTALWTNRFDDPSPSWAFGRFLAADLSNNVVVAGDAFTGATGSAVVALRYTSEGAQTSTIRYNSSDTNTHQLIGLALDPSGNVYLAESPSTSSGPAPDYTTLKYNADGRLLWTRRYKGATNGVDYAEGIATDSAGNVFVTGDSGSESANFSIATLKYSSDGMPLWTNRFQLGFGTLGRAILVDRMGNVIVAGESIDVTVSYPIIQYASDGTPRWTNYLAGPNYSGGRLPLIAVNPAGDIYVVDGSPGTESRGDYNILKLTSSGTPVWTNRFTGLDATNGTLDSIAADPAGNLYLAGYWTAPGNATDDYLTVKYSPDGTPVWTNRYDGRAGLDDIATSVAADGTGNIYVTGWSARSNGGTDYATIKYADYLLYSPPTNFIGTDTITYTVTDDLGNRATGALAVNVTANILRFNIAPEALNLSAGGLLLNVGGAVGTNAVVIYASTNLIQWQSILTNSPASGSAQFLDPSAGAAPYRFYKAVQSQ